MNLQQAQCSLIGSIFNKNQTVLAYADDILSHSKTHIIETVNKIETEATKFGLIVKNEKTKIMQLIRNTKLHTETLKIKNHTFKILNEFK